MYYCFPTRENKSLCRKHLTAEEYLHLKTILTDLRNYLKISNTHIHLYSKKLGFSASALSRYFNGYDKPSKRSFQVLNTWHKEYLSETSAHI